LLPTYAKSDTISLETYLLDSYVNTTDEIQAIGGILIERREIFSLLKKWIIIYFSTKRG